MPTDLKNGTLSIECVRFDVPGKITLDLADGRSIAVPLKYFPEIEQLNAKERHKHTIVDDRTLLFFHLDQVYHLEDFMGLEEKWRER